MLSFDNAAAIAAAPTTASIDPDLQQLIADRVHDWTATGLLDLTYLLIVQVGDVDEELEEEVAFSPLVNPLTGHRFGDKDFEPWFDWLERHEGWFELIFTVGNDGYAFVLFIQDAEESDPELCRFCQTYAELPVDPGSGEVQ